MFSYCGMLAMNHYHTWRYCTLILAFNNVSLSMYLFMSSSTQWLVWCLGCGMLGCVWTYSSSQLRSCSTHCLSVCTYSSRPKEGPLWNVHPPPSLASFFFLRSKTYSKECPPSASIANREFPLSDKLEDVVRLIYKLHITLLHSGLH